MSDPQPPSHHRPSRDELVQQIVADVERQQEDVRRAIRPERRSRAGPIALAVLLAVNLVAWLVFPPPAASRADLRTEDQMERDLRFTLASAAGDIETWRAAHEGRLPSSLVQAGVTDTVVTYARVDGSIYELRVRESSLFLSYRSTIPLADFVAPALPPAMRPVAPLPPNLP